MRDEIEQLQREIDEMKERLVAFTVGDILLAVAVIVVLLVLAFK